jgi:chloramphenicol-sensitive protein RarD
VPLTLFAFGARRLRFTTLGLLQYIAPTCQFLIGWLLYHEPFNADRAGAFGLIWLGLALYTFDAIQRERSRTAPATAPGT